MTTTVQNDRPQRRARRQVLTDKMIADLPRKAKPYFYGDPEMPRHGVRVVPGGPPHSFYVVARSPGGRQRWKKIGDTGAALPIKEAREKARHVIERIAQGLEPEEPVPVVKDSVADVCANYLKLHVEKNKILTAPDIRRMLSNYVLPAWGKRVFTDLKRSDVTALLDHIEAVGLGKKKKSRGAPKGSRSRQADQVLALLTAIGRWHQGRVDDWTCPYAGMKRRVLKDDRARSRQLDDDELRAVWLAAEKLGADGAFFQVALLCAQRREKVVTMKWSAIAPDGTWTIPRLSNREKNTADKLRLPRQALDILKRVPRFAGNDYVFVSGRSKTKTKTKNIADAKAALDEASGVTGWVTHDLRRNARSLMKRAGVDTEVAELVLGHRLLKSAVQKVYDVSEPDYEAMAEAVQAAANLLDRIVAGQSAKMRQLRPVQAS